MTDSRKAEIVQKWNSRTPMTQEEIAVVLGVSRGTVYTIERQALSKIAATLRREMFGPCGKKQ